MRWRALQYCYPKMMTIWIVTMNVGCCDQVARPVSPGQYIYLKDPAQVVYLVKSIYWLSSVRCLSIERSHVSRPSLEYRTNFRSRSSQVLGVSLSLLLFSYFPDYNLFSIRLLNIYAVTLSPKSWLIVITTTSQATITMRMGTSMSASKSVEKRVSEL